MISSIVMAIVFKFAVGECILDPGQNKYLVLAQDKVNDAYVLKSIARPDLTGAIKRAVVDSEGTKVSCQ